MSRNRLYRKHRNRTVLAAALVLTWILGATATESLAYFTTYATAKGSCPVSLGSRTEIEESFDNWTKTVRIVNMGDVECWVRVKAFAGSEYPLEYSNDSGKWSLGEDGYWYYSDIVAAGESTEELCISITVSGELSASFNVVVIQECTPVLYWEDGTPYADWTLAADSGEGA